VSHEQTTRYTSSRRCLLCGALVKHRQVVDFTPMKVYSFVPVAHRRPTGTQCTRGEPENRNP
jgi:hypothetical protein